MSFIDELIEKIMNKQRRKRTLLIEESKKSETQNETQDVEETIEPKEIKVEYFSRVEEGKLIHDVRIVYDGEIIPVGNLSSKKDDNNLEYQAEKSIREIVNEIQKVINPLNESESTYGLEKLKEETKNVLQRISQKNPNFVLDEEVMDFIEDFKPEQVIDYEQLDKLPKKIDVDKLTHSQKKQISIKMRKRMKELEQIRTTENAWADREKIISFIQSIENIPENTLMDAKKETSNQEHGLNEETAKLMNEEIENIKNEDGELYSVYLKIEEKRVWKKIRTEIIKYANDSKMNREGFIELIKAIGELNKYELKDIQKGFSSQILGYIIDEKDEKTSEEKVDVERAEDEKLDIETYIEKIRKNDLLLTRMITSKFPDMENKDKILSFFHSRIASLGQLSNKKKNTLRKFIETTDYKDEYTTETKQFLLLASQIEKVYIKSQFKDLLEISNERKTANMNAFKENIAYTVIKDKDKKQSTTRINGEDITKENLTKEDFTKE